MSFQDEYKITSEDRQNKGVTGLPDTPGLSTAEMEARLDSLSNLAIDKFNALVDAVSDTLDNSDLKLPTNHAVNNAIQNISVNMEEYVDNWLDEHPEATTTVQDGSITIPKLNSDVIDAIQQHGVPKTGKKCVNIHHVYRFDSNLKENASAYRNGQSGTYIPGEETYVYCIRGIGTNTDLIREVDWNTGVTVRESELSLEHCNWISYNPDLGCLYVSSFMDNVTGDRTAKVYVVRYSDMTIINTIDFSSKLETALGEYASLISLASFHYDYITHEIYLSSYAYFSNIGDYKPDIFRYDQSTGNIIHVDVHENLTELSRAGTQGVMVYNNIGYYLKSEDFALYLYDFASGDNIGVIALPVFDNLGQLLGEYEQISSMSLSDIEPSFCVMSVSGLVSSSYNLYYISRMSPFDNVNEKVWNTYRQGQTQVYVDYTQNDVIQDGSNAHPYSTIEQAMRRVCGNDKQGGRIYLVSSADSDVVGTWNLQPFAGSTVHISKVAGQSIDFRINGLLVENQNLSLYGLSINRINSNDGFTYGLNIRGGSKVRFTHQEASTNMDINFGGIDVDYSEFYFEELTGMNINLHCGINPCVDIVSTKSTFPTALIDSYFHGKLASATGTSSASDPVLLGKVNFTNSTSRKFATIQVIIGADGNSASFNQQFSNISPSGVSMYAMINGTEYKAVISNDNEWNIYLRLYEDGVQSAIGYRAFIESM